MKKVFVFSLKILWIGIIGFLVSRSLIYSHKFEKLSEKLIANPTGCRIALVEALEKESVSEERIFELLAIEHNFVQSIEFSKRYPGVFLITKDRFPSTEGILLSSLKLEPVSRDENLGIEIIPIASDEGMHLYNLCYFFD